MSVADSVAHQRLQSSEASAQFREVYDYCRSLIAEKRTLTPQDLLWLTISLMTFCEKLPQTSGLQRRQLIISVLSKVIDEIDVNSDADLSMVSQLIKSEFVGNFIDWTISASKGEIDINKSKFVMMFKGCFGGCFGGCKCCKTN